MRGHTMGVGLSLGGGNGIIISDFGASTSCRINGISITNPSSCADTEVGDRFTLDNNPLFPVTVREIDYREGYAGEVHPPQKIFYWDVPIYYEYITLIRLGFSTGIGFFVPIGKTDGVGFGISLSEFGVSYHLKNGINFLVTGNVGGTLGELSQPLWTVGESIGYTF